MDVYNVTKKKRVCDCKEVNGYLGLMFQRPHPVVFSFRTPRIIALHNFFVLGTIDCLFLLKGKVVEIKRGFRPFTFYTPKNPATHVIEVPAGMAKGVTVGDRLRLG